MLSSRGLNDMEAFLIILPLWLVVAVFCGFALASFMNSMED